MAGIKGAVQKLASQAEIASDADVILESAGKFEDTTVYKKERTYADGSYWRQ